MFRGAIFLLAVGLFAVWAVGLASPLAASWLVWLDGAVAVGAFGLAAASDSTSRFEDHYSAGPFGIALALALFGLLAIAQGVVAWLTVATFAFAGAFSIVAALARNQSRIARSRPDRSRWLADTMNDRIRKAG